LLWLLEKVPLFVLSAVACLVTVYAQKKGEAVGSLEYFPLGERLLNTPASYVRYLGKLVWPSKLAALYPHPHDRLLMEEAIRATLILLAITGLVLWCWRRRYLTVGWLWFLGTLVPVIGLVQVGSQAMADRYTYLPYIGLFIALTWGAADLAERWTTSMRSILVPAALLLGIWVPIGLWVLRQDGAPLMEDGLLYRLLSGLTAFVALGWVAGRWVGWWPRCVSPVLPAAALILGCWIALTAFQARLWQNSIWLWEHTVGVTEKNPLAQNQLGEAYWQSKHAERIERAKEHYQECLNLLPNHANALNNFALVCLELGQLDVAESYLERAQTANPRLTVIWINRGMVLHRQGRYENAIEMFQEVLRRDPALGVAYGQLGRALAGLERWQDAETALRQAVELEPKRIDFRADLGWAFWHLDRKSEAAREYAAVVQIDPDWPEEARRAAWTWATDARPARRNGFEAVRLAEQSCQARNQCDAHFFDTLAAAYAEVGRFEDAVQWAKQALEVAGDDAKALRREIEQRLEEYRKNQPYRQPA